MNSTKKPNNKSMMLIFLAVFLLPVILAKLALDNGWFNQAATNKGILIQPPLSMSSLQGSEQDPKWKLVYVLPQVCDAGCENALYSIVQVWSALGKHSDRAEVVVVSHAQSNAQQFEQLKAKKSIRLVESDLENINSVFKGQLTEGIFIADTLDNVILRYPLQNDAQQAILESRDILADMRKVLKLSRIG